MDLPVTSTEQSRFLIHVADGTQISPYDLEIGILPNIIFGHLEHSKVQVGHWTE